MAEDEAKEPWQLGDVKFSGYSLDDEVRKRYFERFELSLKYFEINQYYVLRGFRPKYANEFVASVCSLYIELFPKKDYDKNNPLSENFSKLETFIKTGTFEFSEDHLKYIARASGDDDATKKSTVLYFEFVDFYFKLRKFIEGNGITKYERSQYNPAEMIMRGVAKS